MRGHIRQRGKKDENGKASWQLKFDAGRDAAGKRNIQFVTFRGTKREAQTKLADLISAAGKGIYIEPSKVTIAEHMRGRLKQWRESGDIGAKTLERYSELIEFQIVPHIGAKPLQKLGLFDIQAWHAALRTKGRHGGQKGVSVRTIRSAHFVLQCALDEAVVAGLTPRNIACLVSPPAVPDEEMAILTPEQVADVVNKLKGRGAYASIMTALFTGMRCGEIIALRWGAVDLDKKAITVREAIEETKKGGLRFKAPKTRAGRREITLPDIVVNVLREHRKAALERRVALGLGKLPDDAIIFPAAAGGPQSPQVLSKAWKRAADELKIKRVSLHGLRHTHASQLIDAGVDIVTIASRLGHARPSVTLAIYSHLFKKTDAKAAAAINGALSGLGVS